MSNLKIKNQKERTTSFWQFAGIATIPLLLSLFVGYQWGHTSLTEDLDYKQLYEKSNEELMTLRNDVAEFRKYIVFSDSITNLVLDKASDWDRDYKTSFDEDENSDMWKKIKKRYNEYEDKVEDFRDEHTSRKNQLADLTERSSIRFKTILEKRENITNLIGDKKGLMIEKGTAEDFEDKEDEFEDEMSEKQAELRAKDDQLRDKNFEIKVLNDKITKLQEDNIPTVDNNLITAKGNASKIMTEVEAIKNDIIPNLTARKLLGIKKNADLEKKVVQLKGKLDNIYQAAVTSANL